MKWEKFYFLVIRQSSFLGTLEFARRLDAWLAAIILYAVSLYQQEDKLQVFNMINSIDSISDVCIDWEFDQDECQLNWE